MLQDVGELSCRRRDCSAALSLGNSREESDFRSTLIDSLDLHTAFCIPRAFCLHFGRFSKQNQPQSRPRKQPFFAADSQRRRRNSQLC